jgi:FkbM family methyltransferase
MREMGLQINKNEYFFLLSHYDYLKAIKVGLKPELTLSKNRLIVAFDELRLIVETAEEMKILIDVFIKREYGYELKNNRDYVLIDAGMNCGFTSLFFAQQEEIIKIYAFEPMKVTYEAGLANFSLNKDISQKIDPLNYGLGKSNRTVTVPYNRKLSGRIGISRENYLNRVVGEENLVKYEMVIRDSSEVLQPIIEYNSKGGNSIILKIDTEGSELEIVDSLGSADLLQFVECILLEWHDENVNEIEGLLNENGFQYIRINHGNQKTGMIYAINCNA